MIVQIFDKDVLKVLTIFSLSPGSRFLRKDIKEKTKLNNVNLDNAINILFNSDLIKKERKFLYFGLASKKILDLIHEEYIKLRELPLDVYFLIIDMVFNISKLKNADVYLFGSYSKLIFKENSDIDIAIVSEKINKKVINNMASKLDDKYSRKIEVHYFGKSFYNNKKDPIVKDILRNGIRLI